MELKEILEKVMVINRDDGKRFICTDRIDAINKILWNSRYRRVNPQGLFLLYSVKPIEEIEHPFLISSHIDCEEDITKCFTSYESDMMLKGTYDNGVTNAAILYLMLNNKLPDNVIVAFTGDEEVDSTGAKQVSRFLRKKGKLTFTVLVLDVTDMGWKEKADFTIENNFWSELLGESLIESLKEIKGKWLFVPSDLQNIPSYVASDNIIYSEAEADESWDYDEEKLKCFSLCLPVYGEMHSDEGVLLRLCALNTYVAALDSIINTISCM